MGFSVLLILTHNKFLTKTIQDRLKAFLNALGEKQVAYLAKLNEVSYFHSVYLFKKPWKLFVKTLKEILLSKILIHDCKDYR